MWPFDLRGPEFLLFYLATAAIVITALILLRHVGEPTDTPKVNLSDPYLIAFLRGGKNEALRVVTMSLFDRGLLTMGATKTAIKSTEGAWGKTRSELEQKIVKHFTPSADAATLFKMKDANPEMERYGAELTGLGLLPDADRKTSSSIRMWLAIILLVGLAVTKITVAIQTGHNNFGFLVTLGILLPIGVVAAAKPSRTKAGDRMIADLRTLFDGLKQRSEQIQNGASPAEFTLMAAVFGMATVPYAKALFPQSSSSCGGGCGSSSGGSSCGGGGCGGCGGG
jgi:uncharacterized protein (TIGR04222 family)